MGENKKLGGHQEIDSRASRLTRNLKRIPSLLEDLCVIFHKTELEVRKMHFCGVESSCCIGHSPESRGKDESLTGKSLHQLQRFNDLVRGLLEWMFHSYIGN